ncbi:MAG: molybdenum cofactor guanylyltransferase [Pirellulales bacterium]
MVSCRDQSVVAVVLAGGRSRRMGTPKAWLPFGAELMLPRVVRLLGQAVGEVVVVACAGQKLPDLPGCARVIEDSHEDAGPMEGLATGLEWLHDRAEYAFVTGCDAPLLVPAFVRRMIELARGFDVAVPHVGGVDQPYTAVYGTSLAPQIREALAASERRIVSLFERVATRRVLPSELQDVDPGLQSLFNVNDRAAYQAALDEGGFGGEAKPG